MPTIQEFRQEVRTLLKDPVNPSAATTGLEYQDTELDIFRKKAVRFLAKPGIRLYNETTNYSTLYTDMPLAVSTSLDYVMPTNWVRVTGVEYWTNESNTMYSGQVGLFDDRARSGYVRIFDGPSNVNARIMMYGFKPYTEVTDTAMPGEVYDVCVSAAVCYAIQAAGNKRALNRRSLTAQDTTIGGEALWLSYMKRQLKEDVRQARKALRMIGRN